MTTIFTDTFTQVVSVALTAHTPDTGTSWSLLWQSGAGIDINAVSGDTCEQETQSNSGAMYTADATYDSADYYVQFTLTSLFLNAGVPWYIGVRWQDQENGYAVYLNDQGGTNTCTLCKKVAGTWSDVGSVFSPPANGSVCKLEIIGTTLTFYDDGVSIASGTVSDFATAGKVMVGGGGGTEMRVSTDDMNTANDIDNLSIVTIPVSTGKPYYAFAQQ